MDIGMYSENSETLFLKSRYQYFYTSFHASKKQVMSAYNEHVLQMTHCGKIQAGNGRKRWATSAFTKMITPPHLSMQLEGRHVKCQYVLSVPQNLVMQYLYIEIGRFYVRQGNPAAGCYPCVTQLGSTQAILQDSSIRLGKPLYKREQPNLHKFYLG